MAPAHMSLLYIVPNLQHFDFSMYHSVLDCWCCHAQRHRQCKECEIACTIQNFWSIPRALKCYYNLNICKMIMNIYASNSTWLLLLCKPDLSHWSYHPLNDNTLDCLFYDENQWGFNKHERLHQVVLDLIQWLWGNRVRCTICQILWMFCLFLAHTMEISVKWT